MSSYDACFVLGGSEHGAHLLNTRDMCAKRERSRVTEPCANVVSSDVTCCGSLWLLQRMTNLFSTANVRVGSQGVAAL
jgi:hypothetical protein